MGAFLTHAPPAMGETKRRLAMANRRFQRLQALQKEIKKLHVKITTDGSGDVTAIVGTGIASVSHAAGTYTITLEDKYNVFIGAAVLPGVSSAFNLNAEDVSGAKTVDIDLAVSQASVDIHVEIMVKNTSVVK